jgi:protein PhnA
MSTSLPKCPKCSSEYTYEDGTLYVCPECAHEWSRLEAPAVAVEIFSGERVYKDANGNVLRDGDSVTVIKDLKVKGSSLVVKGHEGEERFASWTKITTSTARSTVSAP